MTLVDQQSRDAAITEHRRNVVIDAGAGTGKTTTLVRRLIAMLAPPGEHEPLPVERIAAVTFTRRAAGELRLRIRERILEELGSPETDERRRHLLRAAISGLDGAAIGTVHSFADRLLRMRPVASRLSPSYEIHEDDEGLVQETYQLLRHCAETASLRTELAGVLPAALLEETEETLRDAVRGRVRSDTRELEFFAYYGLDALVRGYIGQRDVVPVTPPLIDFDFTAYRGFMREFIEGAAPVVNDSHVGQWAAHLAQQMERLLSEDDAVVLLAEIARELFEKKPHKIQKAKDCGNDKALWAFWKLLVEGKGRDDRPLRDDLMQPLFDWMSRRLVRMAPVVLALYDKVKARHEAVDQLDLLLKLRDMLRDDLEARAYYQALFDHIFVDEFQDTDPLQAEVLLYLCEKGSRARSWLDVELGPGRLTIVGDPKQSIYRFRRADVAMYDRVRRKVVESGALEVELSANFRSLPAIIDWGNARFRELLGADQVRYFDPDIGRVFHQDLTAARDDKRAPAIHVVPFEVGEETSENADKYRTLEGEVTAAYVQWLVEKSGHLIRDPLTGELRAPHYGDIAVLAISTFALPLLFTHLDTRSIPYASAGGTLFLRDPVHRQFLLGLRALADRDDGAAMAALMRPPFFSVDLEDLFVNEVKEIDVADPRVTRARAAREHVRELRRRRFERGPGETARDLLELTAFARHVAMGPNGAQRLERLRELCHLLEIRAADRSLDFDAVTGELRSWIDDPEQIDAPRPVDAQAVQVLTVHQAKGLEFPVVIWWDGRASAEGIRNKPPWATNRDGSVWSINLYGLESTSTPGVDLASQEKRYRDEERRRVTYVACTRARDLLVLPKAGDIKENLLCGLLIGAGGEDGALQLDPYVEGQGAVWSRGLELPTRAAAKADDGLEERIVSNWNSVRQASLRTVARSVAVSTHAHDERGHDDAVEAPRLRTGRHGPIFGTVVHAALGQVLLRPDLSVEVVVNALAGDAGIADKGADAVADVRRALAALADAGLISTGSTVRLEYPLAGSGPDGTLLVGSADLVVLNDDKICVVDFKTDAPPTSTAVVDYPAYVAQVQTYARLLGVLSADVRSSLLFTADGSLHWA